MPSVGRLSRAGSKVGQWHLFKFYRGVLTILDRGSISRGKHRLTITAKDNCGNISEYTGTLAL